ncbi:MAG: arsenite/tail-anchored protein-transporting ATPase [Actinomycetota bacterium]|nr:arsenite/tail-anchored protein-transporting ATPase [Actinomycetota bacterium]
MLEAELANEEVVGMPALSIFAKHLYGDTDVAARLSHTEPFTVDAEGDALLLSVQLPFTDQSDVQLGRTGDELVLTVGPHRRALMLPDSLVRRDVAGARFVDDRLVVEFV